MKLMRYEYVPEQKIPMLQSYLPIDIYDEIINGGAWAIACIEEGTVLGLLAAVLDQSICRLLWMSVAENRRREGIATRLLVELFMYIEPFPEIERLQLEMITSDRSVPVFRLLLKLGFLPVISEQTQKICTLTYDEYQKQPMMQCECKLSNIYSMAELEQSQYRCLMEGMCDELPYSWKVIVASYDPLLSHFILRDEAVKAMVLVRRISEKRIQVSYLYARAGSEQSTIRLLIYMCEFCRGLLTPDTIIEMALVDESSVRLVEKLLPTGHFRNIYEMVLPIRMVDMLGH